MQFNIHDVILYYLLNDGGLFQTSSSIGYHHKKREDY